jgi:isopentenyl phosphate kinase
MKKIIVLKLGGSIITQKHRNSVFVRRALLARIAKEIHGVVKKNSELQLIIIHGAGAAGHQTAKKYRLEKGTGNDKKKIHGALLIREANQKLNFAVSKIFTDGGVKIVSVHTSSIIIQKDGEIASCSYAVLESAINQAFIPILYGEMVFDTTLGMSICSGDIIAMHLAKRFGVEKILFASDVDGIYDKDPYEHQDAKIIRTVSLKNLLANKNIKLSGSHHIDVTGGMKNKIVSIIKNGIPKNLKEVAVFNGLRNNAFTKAIAEKNEGTIITI